MRWPWQKPAPPEAPKLTDVRFNGTYFEVLTSITSGGDGTHLQWDPYIDELLRWRFVEVAPGVMATPMTTVYDELLAEGWTPPGDRDLPPVLCLATVTREVNTTAGKQKLRCHMLAGHSGAHQDLASGWSWR